VCREDAFHEFSSLDVPISAPNSASPKTESDKASDKRNGIQKHGGKKISIRPLGRFSLKPLSEERVRVRFWISNYGPLFASGSSASVAFILSSSGCTRSQSLCGTWLRWLLLSISPSKSRLPSLSWAVRCNFGLETITIVPESSLVTRLLTALSEL